MSAEAVPQTSRREDGTPPPPDAQTPVRIEPLFDRLLVLQKEEKKETSGGIEIAEQYREKPTEGKVIAVGRECTAAKVGDRVLFHLFSGVKLPEDYGKNLVMLAQGELVALLHRG